MVLPMDASFDKFNLDELGLRAAEPVAWSASWH
jgi:hypothetical protein